MLGAVTVAHRIKGSDVDAKELSSLIPVAAVLCIGFTQEKQMARFRRLVYSINQQQQFRYRTMRGDGAMWELLVLRLK